MDKIIALCHVGVGGAKRMGISYTRYFSLSACHSVERPNKGACICQIRFNGTNLNGRWFKWV
jgi:hypothetical protein